MFYKQLLKTIITAVNYNLFKNQFRLTPKNVGSYLRVFTEASFTLALQHILIDRNTLPAKLKVK